MNILLVQNPAKLHAKELSEAVTEYLQAKNAIVIQQNEYSPGTHVDLIVSLGGDGSILKIIHEFTNLTAPIMGINLGSLGFLADIGVSGMYDALDMVLQNAFQVQDRLMLEGFITEGDTFLAVNEILAHRGKNNTLIDLSLHVDGVYLNTFSADGVIVATPSGSTAYSLSAGGPILSPELDSVVITPICPHTISNRPIVLKMHNRIEIRCLSNHEPVEIGFDGILRFHLKKDETLIIRKAARPFRLVSFKHSDFFDTLRTKLGWAGSLKT